MLRANLSAGTQPRSLSVTWLLALSLIASIIALAVAGGASRDVVLLAGLILIMWGVWRTVLDPFWLIFALVLEETIPYLNLLPFDPDSRWWIRYPILFCLCLPTIPAAWKSGVLKRGYFAGYLVYFGWAAVSVAYSSDPAISVGRLLPAVMLFIALARVTNLVRTREDLQKLVERFLMACAVLVALNIAAAVAFPNSIYIEGETPEIGIYSWSLDPIDGMIRFCGFSGDPNVIGSLMLVTVAAGLVYWQAAHGWRRQALVVLIGSSAVLALLADSRSAFVALIAGIAALAIWKYRIRGLACCVAALILLVGIYVAMGRARQSYVTRDVDTLTGRTTLWEFEAQKVSESPLLGYGYDVEGKIFDDRHFPLWDEAFARGSLTPLHNGYLTVAIGIGVPALAFWLFLLLAPWVSLFRRERDDLQLKPIFFLVVVSGLVRAFAESGISEPRLPEGLLLFLFWMVAERYRFWIIADRYRASRRAMSDDRRSLLQVALQ